MDVTPFQASGSIVIAASPEDVYSFIADMPRIGELSPECLGGEWESDPRGVGATFMGSNKNGDREWQARMRVVAADPPREIAWENLGNPSVPFVDDKDPIARWRYTFTPVEGGTQVNETWQILNITPIMGTDEATIAENMARRTPFVSEMIGTTLDRLKQRFEN